MAKDDLVESVEEALREFPPDDPKNIQLAFISIVVDTTKGVVDWHQWQDIYKHGNTAEAITDALLNAKKPRLTNLSFAGAGKGGHRGLSNSMKNLKGYSDRIIKINRIRKKLGKISLGKLVLLTMSVAKGETVEGYSDEAVEELTRVVESMCHILKEWLAALDPKNPKHLRACKIVFESSGEPELNPCANYSVPTKGRQLTERQFTSATAEISQYLVYGDHRSRTSKFYGDKKFYYLTTQIPFIFLALGISEDIKKKRALQDIELLLKGLFPDTRNEILQRLANQNGWILATVDPTYID